MTETTTIFDSLESCQGDPAGMLEMMIRHFREQRSAMELFEAMKMQIRQKVGLPLVATENEPARPEEVERQLEMGLLDACRESGTMLIKDGKVAEGWMYLRPTSDLELAKKLLESVEITDENYDEMIQVLLHEGVDVGRGYQAVLEHQGTCNSITLFEQSIVGRSKADRKAAAAKLLDHFYHELIELVRADVADRKPDEAVTQDETLGDIIESRRWILDGGGYHLDTTHLAATVRIASILDEPDQIRRAWELTQYGRRLNHQFQYPGDEPFVDFYPAYSTFYGVLLGENVEAGLKHFEKKARSVDAAQHGTGALETYVDLLDRVGRHAEAVSAAAQWVPEDVPPQRIVPMMIEIGQRAGIESRADAFKPILEYCQRRGDVLGYGAALHASVVEA